MCGPEKPRPSDPETCPSRWVSNLLRGITDYKPKEPDFSVYPIRTTFCRFVLELLGICEARRMASAKGLQTWCWPNDDEKPAIVERLKARYKKQQLKKERRIAEHYKI